MSAAYDFLQGEGGLYGRAMDDFYRRLNARPRIPNAPTLTSTAYVEDNGNTRTEVTVNYASARPKLMDYIASWSTTESSSPTYERIRSFPHVIRPVPPGTTVTVDMSVERRHTGARSPFGAERTIVTPGDTNAPATPTGLTCATNPYQQSITLQWNANTEADFWFYRVYRNGALINTTDYNAFEDLTGTPGTSYTYTVSAVDSSQNESALSTGTTCSIRFLGTISVTPNKTAITNPPAAFGTVISQVISVPSGTVQMTAPVTVRSNSIVGGSDTVQIRAVLTVGIFSATSGTATVHFGSGQAGEDRTVYLQFTGITSSGWGSGGSIAYQWMNNNDSEHQLTTPAAWITE